MECNCWIGETLSICETDWGVPYGASMRTPNAPHFNTLVSVICVEVQLPGFAGSLKNLGAIRECLGRENLC